MLKLFREAGIPRRLPPRLPACTAEDSSETPHILSPRLGVSYTLRRSRPADVIALDASAAADVQSVFWFDGGALIGRVPVSAGVFSWRPTADGEHLVRAIDDHGRAAERGVHVILAP
jgi:penicillin-binding protein 1C